MSVTIHTGDCLKILPGLPRSSVDCCVTSPPYWGCLDYGASAQLGNEETRDGYIARMVEVFRQVRETLKDEGTLWLNLGDSYNAYNGGSGPGGFFKYQRRSRFLQKKATGHGLTDKGLKPKDLLGMPWRVALALQGDDWYLRSEIIWEKPSATWEAGAKDRPSRNHEHVFLLSKNRRYYFGDLGARRPRTVWHLEGGERCKDHPADFPPALPRTCIILGCPEGGTVLDPFLGSGTTAMVADRLQREAIGIEVNPEYAKIARRRVVNDGPLFADVRTRE